MSVTMNFKILTKNHAADLEIRSPPKIDFRADETQESQLKAWELRVYCVFFKKLLRLSENHATFSKIRKLLLTENYRIKLLSTKPLSKFCVFLSEMKFYINLSIV